MRVKVDENLPQEVAQPRCENGHDAVSVFDQTLSGEDDPTVFEVCQDEGRVLVSLDLDFANTALKHHRASPVLAGVGSGSPKIVFAQGG